MPNQYYDDRRNDDELYYQDPDTVIGMNEPHVPCIIMLDVSGSMSSNNAIGLLNDGIKFFKDQTLAYDARKSTIIDVAIVSFGGNGVQLVQNFKPIRDMTTPVLSASGNTPLGEAINFSLKLMRERKNLYRQKKCNDLRGWIFCLTDGIPTDIDSVWNHAVQALHQSVAERSVIALCTAVGEFKTDKMVEMFGEKSCLYLSGLDFTKYFEFVSNSLGKIHESAKIGTDRVGIAETQDVKFKERFFD
jgi:uncharacterized protein YegL